MVTKEKTRQDAGHQPSTKRAIDYLVKSDEIKSDSSKLTKRMAVGGAIIATVAAIAIIHGGSNKPQNTKGNWIESTRDTYYLQEGYKFISEPRDFSGKFIYQTKTLEYQFKAIKESKPDFTSYEVNGVTDKGWWYQTGLDYNRYQDKFRLFYEIWNDKGQSVIPSTGAGFVYLNGKVNEGDDIRTTLKIENNKVYMIVTDLTTKAEARVDFDSKGGSMFIWDTANVYFTGPMTEAVAFKQANVELQHSQEYYRISGPTLSENNYLFFQSEFKVHEGDSDGRTIYTNKFNMISEHVLSLSPGFSYTLNGQTKLMIQKNPNNPSQPTEVFITTGK